MIKQATLDDVTHVAARMRADDAVERLALSYGDNVVQAAIQFLNHPHLAVTVWRGAAPVAVIGVVFPHPGVASTVFFATPDFPKVALATTRFIRRTLFPILLSTGIHRVQVCSMGQSYSRRHRWILGFGATREAELIEYGKNRETFTLYVLDKAGMARVTSGGN